LRRSIAGLVDPIDFPLILREGIFRNRISQTEDVVVVKVNETMRGTIKKLEHTF
jgi:hypothetical protein